MHRQPDEKPSAVVISFKSGRHLMALGPLPYTVSMRPLLRKLPLWLVLLLAAAASVAQPPNVVLILADDLGYGDIGAFGSRLIETPHIDSLARDGIRMTDFYASGNVCSPSRAGLLTGRYAVRDGMAAGTVTVGDTHGLPPGTPTLAEVLQRRGYRTALIGKWHLGHHTGAQRPNARGFDLFYGLLHPNDEEQPLYRNAAALPEPLVQSELTRRFTGEAVQFIDRNAHRPFFLYLAHTAPHIPLAASPEFAGSSRAGTYGDVVQELDSSVGAVLDALARNGVADNTAVVFTSDNGPFPEGGTGGLRGGKGTAWEGGFRVPFVARWPGRIPEGRTTGAMAMNIDLFPTVVALARMPPPLGRKLDGRNILPLLTGAANESPHEVLYYFNHDRIAGLRTQDWKILVRADYRNIERWLPGRDIRLLFDMRTDPTERYSLAEHRPDKWRELEALLKRGQREFAATGPNSPQ